MRSPSSATSAHGVIIIDWNALVHLAPFIGIECYCGEARAGSSTVEGPALALERPLLPGERHTNKLLSISIFAWNKSELERKYLDVTIVYWYEYYNITIVY